MVKIRLTRVGSKKRPMYRIVVMDSRLPRDGRCIEILGHYNPHSNPATFEVNAERAMFWLQQGAQASETVRSLFRKQGFFKKTQEDKAA